MAETAALSPQYLKQLREEREARLAAKKGASAPAPTPPPAPPQQQRGDAIEIESSDDEVQIIASAPKRKRADDDDEVQFLPSPPKRGSTGGTFSCVICMDDVERSQRLKLRNCGHAFCGECVAGTLRAALDDKKVDDRLRCPDTTCRKPLDVLDVRACTYDRGDKATWSKYQEVATEALLDQANADEGNEKGLRRCPGDKCNHTFYYEPHATSGTLHICQKCHGAFCLGCPLVGGKVGPAHDGNCAYVMQQEAARKAHQEKYDKWSIENAQADEKFNELMRKERQKGATKPCPKCKQAITKNHGCDHMTCMGAASLSHRDYRLDGVSCPFTPSPRPRNTSTASHHTGPCGHEFYWSTGKPYRTGLGAIFGGWGGGGGADY